MNDLPQRAISIVGLAAFLFIAWLLSENRRRMNFRLIASGVSIQLALGVFLLRTSLGEQCYKGASRFLTLLVDAANHASGIMFTPDAVRQCVALRMLPAIIFVSSLTAILFHFGVLQIVVRAMARVMVWIMDVSGTESLAASANVFVGMTEAPLVVRPYLLSMTRSELMAMMTSGMATIAGGMMAIYAGILRDAGVEPGHLLTASLLSAPASLVIAKIMVPEAEKSNTKGRVTVDVPRQDANFLDAACRGAAEGMKLAINVAAMLLAFIALIWLVNWTLACLPHWHGEPITLERIFGYAFRPVAWLMGVSWDESLLVGQFLGKKTVLNEFLAYLDMQAHISELSPRAAVITTYALCGFANFGSVAILIGGIGSLVPERRAELARFGIRSLIGGTLAALMTATVAGMLYAEDAPAVSPHESRASQASGCPRQADTETSHGVARPMATATYDRPQAIAAPDRGLRRGPANLCQRPMARVADDRIAVSRTPDQRLDRPPPIR